MSTFKMTDVVMLATDKQVAGKELVLESILFEDPKLSFKQVPWINDREERQHLYFLSDEEIKEGDWRMMVDKSSKFYGQFEKHLEYQKCDNQWKKIIATTAELRTGYRYDMVPQPTQSFLEVFVKEYNKGNHIKKVMVEYHPELYDGTETTRNLSGRLKINPKDNTITIRKVKDSWSREEVINILNLIDKAASTGIDDSLEDGRPLGQDFIEHWVKQNL